MTTRCAFAVVMSSVVLAGAVVRGEQTVTTAPDTLPPGAIARLQLAPLSFTLNPDGVVAVSPDGKTLAAAVEFSSRLSGFVLHDFASGRTTPLEGPNEQRSGRMMSALAFSPDGKTLMAGTRGGDLYSWSLATGQLRSLLADEKRNTQPGRAIDQTPVLALAFSPDGKYLAVGRDSPRYQQLPHELRDNGTSNTTLIVRHAQTGEKLWTIAAQTGGVMALAFSPDGRVLWSAGKVWERSDRPIRRWDMRSGHEIDWGSSPDINLGDMVQSLTVSPDGRLLAAAAYGRFWVWNTATGRETLELYGHAVWFSPDGEAIVVAERSKVGFWDLSLERYVRMHTLGMAQVRWAAVLPSRNVVALTTGLRLFVFEPSGAGRELRLSGQTVGPVAHE